MYIHLADGAFETPVHTRDHDLTRFREIMEKFYQQLREDRVAAKAFPGLLTGMYRIPDTETSSTCD